MSAIFVYVTVPDAEAKALARQIVEEKLAACANMLPGVTAIYPWEGKIEEGQETVIIFKTQKSLFKTLEERVATLHSYDVPCIVALPIDAGHETYLQWIRDETSKG